MPSFGTWLRVLSALVLTTSCDQPSRVDTAAEASVIRGLSREWLAADQARDVERAVSFYADDAVEIASNTPIAEGKEAIRRWYQTWLPDTTVAISFATDTVVVALSGELAYERGTWKVAADMANSDRPLPG